MLEKILKIATRQSPLALWQAKYIQMRLMAIYPKLKIKLLPLATKGDKYINIPLNNIAGKSLFVKDLELAILDNRADLAVHSIKDIPINFPPELGLVTICKRDNPYDAFISNKYNSINELPDGAIVGTSSLRRKSQLLAYFPNLTIHSIRGNIGTRISKLDAGEYDAIILAAVGLERLEIKERIIHELSAEIILPAVGQGAIGIECRLNNYELIKLLQVLNHKDTALCINAERAMNSRLNGGCQAPIGGFATLKNEYLWLRGLVGSPNGEKIVTGEYYGLQNNAEQIGIALAEELLNYGARDILREI